MALSQNQNPNPAEVATENQGISTNCHFPKPLQLQSKIKEDQDDLRANGNFINQPVGMINGLYYKGKYSRVDKKSSCSAATVLVVIGVCLVCVWIFMLAPVIPGQNPNIPVPGFTTDTKAKVSENPSSKFEDNFGNLPEDAMKDGVNQKTTQDEKISNGDGNNNSEKPVSINEDSNKLVPETNMGDDFGSNESKKLKSVSMSEDENSSSDTNETETFDKLDKKPEDNKNIRAFLSGDQSAILKETQTADGAFLTQAAELASEKESQKPENVYKWKTCNVTTGPDFIPCLDNIGALRKLCKLHYAHRGCSKKKIHKRHCPAESPMCLVALPKGYKIPIRWRRSRDQIWFNNVPRTKLAEVKGNQNWVKVTGEYLTFPGGGTQFKNGALHYIDHIQKSLPAIECEKRTRVILDVGCGVASFGGYLFERDVIAMSFAPKDEHEAQVQFALERGIPAISAVLGTQRLPFSSIIFDAIHCARCRVPWHVEDDFIVLCLEKIIGWKIKTSKTMMDTQFQEKEWLRVVDEISNMSCNNNIWSIIRRLSFVAIVYSTWQERNFRIFKNEERAWQVNCRLICDSVKYKLMGLKIKNSKAVRKQLLYGILR